MWWLIALTAATAVPAESRELVLSVSGDWNATAAEVRTYARSGADAAWTATGPAVQGSLGRSGLAWGRGLHSPRTDGPTKKEGDGRSPAGIYDLRGALGYAPQAPPGTRLPYQVETATLRCVDDPSSAHYNQIVDEAKVTKDWSSAEDMRRPDDLYRLVVVVGHNDGPVTPGGGSCIFLHLRASPTSTTSGCTAFDTGPMESLLRWLDPAKRPILVQLPRAVYESLRTGWGLP